MDMGNLNNILLEILATGVRFYAIKCFIDIFLSKDEYQCKYTWVLYVIACLWTSIIYEIFKMPVLNIISNLTAIFLLVCPYKVKMSRKLLITVMIYAVNVLVDSIVVLSFTKYTVGDSVNQIYECITSLVILIIAIALERTIPIEKDIYLPVVYRISLGAVPVISIGCLYYMVITGTKLKMTVVVVAACILFINILIFYFNYVLLLTIKKKVTPKSDNLLLNHSSLWLLRLLYECWLLLSYSLWLYSSLCWLLNCCVSHYIILWCNYWCSLWLYVLTVVAELSYS